MKIKLYGENEEPFICCNCFVSKFKKEIKSFKKKNNFILFKYLNTDYFKKNKNKERKNPF